MKDCPQSSPASPAVGDGDEVLSAGVVEDGLITSERELVGRMPEGKVLIYTLDDPRTNKPRYVGKTVSPKRRYDGHTKPKDDEINHKANWIRSLDKIGMKPILREIEVVNFEDWEEAETFWITTLRFYGFDLTNAAPGGQSGADAKNKIWKEGSKAAIAEANRNREWNEEAKKKRSEGSKKYWAVEGNKEKHRLRRLLDGTNLKISLAKRGKRPSVTYKWTNEQKQGKVDLIAKDHEYHEKLIAACKRASDAAAESFKKNPEKKFEAVAKGLETRARNGNMLHKESEKILIGQRVRFAALERKFTAIVLPIYLAEQEATAALAKTRASA